MQQELHRVRTLVVAQEDRWFPVSELECLVARNVFGPRAIEVLDLFKRRYPQVRFRPEPNLCFADPAARIVTAGGTTSWHDLALHIISRHVSPGEAMRIAKVYLLKWHDEGQLPYEPLVRQQPHADSVVRGCETWLRDHFREPGVVTRRRARADSRSHAETALQAGHGPRNHRLRTEPSHRRGKHLLESSDQAVDEICVAIGYEDPSFFRRLFKRRTGVAPARYRRVFQPIHRGARAQLVSDQNPDRT